MKLFTDSDVKAALPWPRLIDELRDAFAKGVSQPLRSAHQIPVPGEPDATFLAMPAWKKAANWRSKSCSLHQATPRVICLQ